MVARDIQVDAAVVCEMLENEAVLLNLDTGVYFGLNRSGTAIWRAIVQHGHLETIIRELRSEFAVDAARADQDVRALVRELAAHGLVRGPLTSSTK